MGSSIKQLMENRDISIYINILGKYRYKWKIESSLWCTEGALRVALCTKNLHFVSQKRGKKKYVLACKFSLIKIHLSDYPKSLISLINDVYVFFNKISL